MSSCDECGKGIHAVPYKCRRCGQTLCPEHRLRELHTCKELTEIPVKPIVRS